MNRLTAFLDWIDEAAGALIRLAYLAAGVTAVAVYFGAGHLPPAVEGALDGALPWALSFAVETHTYITARRVRAAWQDRQASTKGSDARERAQGALWVNLGVLAGLLAFSAWNQLGYLVSSGWTPGGSAFALPPVVAYVVRALVVPAAFMAAAFLAPLAEPITAQLETEARATLSDVFKIARKQRRRLLKEAERAGRDMTGALVELVPDPEARRIIAHAYGAIRGEPKTPIVGVLPAPERPPTGPGSPSAVPVRTRGEGRSNSTAVPREAAIRLTTPPEWRQAAAQGRAGRSNPSRVRTRSAEAKVRAAWRPGMSVSELERATGISRSAASKWRKTLIAEQQSVEQSQAAQ